MSLATAGRGPPRVPFGNELHSRHAMSTATLSGGPCRTCDTRSSRISRHERLRGTTRPFPIPSMPGGAADFKALLRRRVRSVPQPFPTTERPILPWALAPFKVLFHSLRRTPWRSIRPLGPSLEGVVRDHPPLPPPLSGGGCRHPSFGSPMLRDAPRRVSSRRLGSLSGLGVARSEQLEPTVGVDAATSPGNSPSASRRPSWGS